MSFTKSSLVAAAIGLVFGFSSVASAEIDIYKIDPAHSSIDFTVKHLMVSKTNGRFNDYKGTIALDPNNLEESKVDVEIDAKSIDTNQEKRDDHLRNADFFDVEKYPTIKFVSTKVDKTGDNQYDVTGDLTIKDVTKSVTIPVTVVGPQASPMGGSVIGVEGEFKINRQDYNVTFNKALDNGGVMVGDEVDIEVSVEAKKE